MNYTILYYTMNIYEPYVVYCFLICIIKECSTNICRRIDFELELCSTCLRRATLFLYPHMLLYIIFIYTYRGAVAKPNSFHSHSQRPSSCLCGSQDVSTYLADLNSETLNSLANEGRLASFRFVYAIPGDIIYLPFGSIVCEKACGANNVSMRTPSMIFTPGSRDAVKFMCAVYPGQLGHQDRFVCSELWITTESIIHKSIVLPFTS